jgi:hypothetical protein
MRALHRPYVVTALPCQHGALQLYIDIIVPRINLFIELAVEWQMSGPAPWMETVSRNVFVLGSSLD